MSHARIAAWLVFALTVPTSAEQPPTAGKVYEVPAEGLVIDGTIREDDPPLAGARGAPHQVFRVKLKKGERYVLYLISGDLDALLVVQDAADKTLVFDHDSAGRHQECTDQTVGRLCAVGGGALKAIARCLFSVGAVQTVAVRRHGSRTPS